MCLKIIGCLLLLSTWTCAQLKSMNPILEWQQLEYDFPSGGNTGTPIDVGVYYRRNGSIKLFVTIPRFTTGIPFTLATVSEKKGPKGPYLVAYPDYVSHSATNSDCDGIISAFRVAIDECDRMWVIDSGIVAGAQVCPPQLLTFDLFSNKLINRFQFSTDVFTSVKSLFINPVVDVRDPPPRGRCQKTRVYIADVTNPGLVVYDYRDNVAWRIENELMRPIKNFDKHTIAGESFVLNDGIFALNLTPRSFKGERYLYFHALASNTENRVPLRLINDQSNWEGNAGALPEAFETLGTRDIQAAMEAIDSKGNIFASSHNVNVFAWNINSPYKNESFRIVADDPEQLQFASGMKVVKNPRGQEELWVSTNRFQKIGAGTQNTNEVNFRILACKIADLLRNKPCNLKPAKIY